MAKYKVKMPDGSIEIVTGPSNMSEEDAIKKASVQHVPQFEKDAKAIKDVDAVDLIMASSPMRFAAGAADFPLGGIQLGARALGVKPVSDWIDRSFDERAKSVERGDLAYGREGFDWMRLLGNVAAGGAATKAAKLGLGLKPAASAFGRIGRGAAGGTGFGLLSPVEDSENYWENKAWQTGGGLILGAGLPAAMEGARGVFNLGKHLTEPFSERGLEAVKGREWLKTAGNRKEDVIRWLTKNKKFVEGSNPTAGQAAARAKSAEFSGLQRSLSKRPNVSSEYLERSNQQKIARSKSIGEIAKTSDDLEKAENFRTSQSKINYRKAWAKSYGGDDELASIADSPYFEAAYRDALKVSRTMNPKVDPRSVEFLHLVKRQLDDQMERVGSAKLGAGKKEAVASLRARFIAWIESKVPEYREARLKHAEYSKPINRMRTGKELKNVLDDPLYDVDEAAAANNNLNRWMSTQRDSAKLVKDAGGNPRFGELKDYLTGDEMERIRNVSYDIARDALYKNQASASSSASGTINKEPFQVHILNRTIVVLNHILDVVQGKATKKVLDSMALDMLDPPTVARIMKKAMISQAKTEKVMGIIRELVPPVTAGAIGASARDPRDTVKKAAGVAEVLWPFGP